VLQQGRPVDGYIFTLPLCPEVSEDKEEGESEQCDEARARHVEYLIPDRQLIGIGELKMPEDVPDPRQF
jgi:hypothetical protein